MELIKNFGDMSILFACIILAIIFGVMLKDKLEERQEKADYEESKEGTDSVERGCLPAIKTETTEPTQNKRTTDMMEFVTDVLTRMGFMYEKLEEGILTLRFQGEDLLIDTNHNPFILIYDMGWDECPLSDVNRVCEIQDAVAKANCDFLPVKIHYTIDDKKKKITVSSYSYNFFPLDFPEAEQYMKYLLDTLMQAHSVYRNAMCDKRQ